MAQINNIPEIIEVKGKLDKLKKNGLVSEWELPYENLLTRISAAVFFLSSADDLYLEEIWSELAKIPSFHYSVNESKVLSELEWQIEFNEESEKRVVVKNAE